MELTDDHDGEVEALLDRLAVDLIGEVSETDIALQLLAESAAQQWLIKWTFVPRRNESLV